MVASEERPDADSLVIRPVAILVPSGKTSTAHTQSLCPLTLVTFEWLSAFHTVTNPAFVPLTTCFPSHDTAMWTIALPPSIGVPTSWPSSTHQRRIFPSSPLLMTCFPSTRNATDHMGPRPSISIDFTSFWWVKELTSLDSCVPISIPLLSPNCLAFTVFGHCCFRWIALSGRRSIPPPSHLLCFYQYHGFNCPFHVLTTLWLLAYVGKHSRYGIDGKQGTPSWVVLLWPGIHASLSDESTHFMSLAQDFTQMWTSPMPLAVAKTNASLPSVNVKVC